MVRNASQVGKLARNRGKEMEREVANNLELELGLSFSRNLQQYHTPNLGDLVCSDKTFPFNMEIKRRQQGNYVPVGAWTQAVSAVLTEGNHLTYPCVIYRYDRLATRCVVPLSAIAESITGKKTITKTSMLDTYKVEKTADLSFDSFCHICREIMAWRSHDVTGAHSRSLQ